MSLQVISQTVSYKRLTLISDRYGSNLNHNGAYWRDERYEERRQAYWKCFKRRPNSYLQILIMASATERKQGQKTARSLFSRKMLLSITTAEGTSFTIVIKDVENRKPGSRQRQRSEIISETRRSWLSLFTGARSVRIYLYCIRIVI